MILTIVEGSSLEFQTKKQKKDHFRLVNNVAVQGLVYYIDWSKTPLTFSEQDLNLESYPHVDALVIKANIAAWEINRVLVVSESSIDIIFVNAFDQMKLSRNQLSLRNLHWLVLEARELKLWGKFLCPFPLEINRMQEHST